jgi:hypothetical protein
MAAISKYPEAAYEFVRKGIANGTSKRALHAAWPESLGPRPGFDAFRQFVRDVRDGRVFVPPKEPALPRGEAVEPDLDVISREDRENERRKFEASLLKKLRAERAWTDRVLDLMLEVAPTIPAIEMPRLVPAPTSHHQAQTAVLLFSDTHIGALVDLEETGGLGEYSYPIFRERLARMRDAIRSIVAHHRQSHPVKNLVIAMLGDLIENVTIFASQAEQVDKDLMAQVLAAIGDIAELLLGLLDTFEHISIVSLTGNHGRIGRKGEHKRHINWDYFISKVLADRFQDNPRIDFEVPKAPFAIVDIEGFNWLFRHGDNIKSWAGIPWYGLERSTGKWIAMQAREGRVLHYAASAHLHQLGSIPYAGVEIIVNGSMVGTTSFSVEVIEAMSRPMQFFAFVHPTHGLAGRYHLVLDRPR